MESDFFRWVIVPLLIFLARVTDVSLGTIRLVFVARGLKGRAALLGFFEILIWLSAISFIFRNLQNFPAYLGYAGGFATGTYLGLRLEQALALGLLSVTVTTNQDASQLLRFLQDKRFGLTSVSAQGSTGRVRMIISIIRRRDLSEFRRIVERFHPNAFMSVQDVRSVSREVYPYSELARSPLSPFSWWRKGK